MKQINHVRVHAVLAQPCRGCDTQMSTKVAWWWTWHGAACSPECAEDLITLAHPGRGCTEECRG